MEGLLVGKKNKVNYDDGRVIAPMNVDGMPWYKPERGKDLSGAPGEPAETSGMISGGGGAGAPVQLTFRENMAFAFGVLKAVLLIAAVFIGVLFGFIMFCIHVWFR